MRSETHESRQLPPLGDPLSRSVWRWQLMLTISVVSIAGGSVLLVPEVFVDWRFLTGLFAIILLSFFALVARWGRVGRYGVLAFIGADIIAIWVLNLGADALMEFLWVFPIAWIATYYSIYVISSALSLFALLILAEYALLDMTVEEAVGLIMLLITLGFVGAMISSGAARNRSTKRLLRAQARRVEFSLQRTTEQKKRTQRLLNSLDLGIAGIGRDGRLQLANSRFKELYSIEEVGTFGRQRSVEYKERRGRSIPRTNTLAARAANGELFEDEIVWLFGIDSKWRALRAATKHVEDSLEVGNGLLLIVEEITDEVDPLASHGETMRMISHELRNPLTAVLGHVDLLLEREDLDRSARAQAEVIERAGERMQTLIDNALAAERPVEEDGDISFELGEPVSASVEAFTPMADAHKVRIDADGVASVPLVGDVFRIRQVIDNVLNNAIKYSHRGSVVRMRSRVVGDDVTLEVTDRGIGISQDDLTHVFDGDFRAQSALDAHVPGTGLGLRISREIAQELGGSLTLESELKRGTTVKLTLPVQGRNSRS